MLRATSRSVTFRSDADLSPELMPDSSISAQAQCPNLCHCRPGACQQWCTLAVTALFADCIAYEQCSNRRLCTIWPLNRRHCNVMRAERLPCSVSGMQYADYSRIESR